MWSRLLGMRFSLLVQSHNRTICIFFLSIYDIDGLGQEKRNSITLELRLSCANPSVLNIIFVSRFFLHICYIISKLMFNPIEKVSSHMMRPSLYEIIILASCFIWFKMLPATHRWGIICIPAGNGNFKYCAYWPILYTEIILLFCSAKALMANEILYAFHC